MKKITAILLSVMMILGGISVNAASDYSEHKYEGAISMLSDLSVMDGYPDGTFRPDANITRAEFAALAIRAAGYENAAAGSTNAFIDIAADSWYLGYANFAQQKGWMTGYDDGRFGGDENVTLNQAIKTMVSVLGYEKIAQQNGGYPSGYIATADTLKLLDKISVGETAATRGEIAQLIANTLTAVTADTTYGENAEVAYGDETLLETLGYGIYTGTVEAVNGISTDSRFNKLSADEIVIGGTKYTTTVSDTAKYLGLTVKFYVYEGKDGSENEVRHMYATRGGYMTIDSDDVKSTTTSHAIDYDYNGKVRSADVDGAVVIYNGKPLMTSEIDDNVFNLKDGSLTLIDNDDDDIFETVLIWEYDNIVVKSVSDDTIYGLYEQKLKLHKDGDENYVTVSYNGEKKSVSDIKQGDVVSAYVSNDGTYARLIISRSETEGIYTSKGKDYIVLDSGEKLRTSSLYETLVSGSSTRLDIPQFGEYVIYKLDAMGKIASSEITEETSGSLTRYGYILSAGTDGIGEDGYVEFLTEDNVIITRPIASSRKLRLGYMDDTQYTVKRTGWTGLSEALCAGGTSVKAQIMKYVEKDGVLTEIYLADKNGSGSKWYENITTTDMRIYAGKLVGDEYIVDNDTKVFYIPNGGKTSDFRAGSVAEIMTSGTSSRSALYDIRNKHVGCIVLCPIMTTSAGYKYLFDSANDPLMLITEVNSKTDDEGDAHLVITGYVDGELEDVFVRDELEKNSESADNLKPGSFIQYKMNTNELKYAETADNLHCLILFKTFFNFDDEFTDEILWNNESIEQTNAIMRTLRGTITYVEDKNVIINVNGTEYPIVLTDYTTVLEYSSSDSVKPLTCDDLSEGQRVFVRQRYNNTREIIIQK